MKKTWKKEKVDQGFTLVELLIAMAVGGIITMATYSVYVVQQRNYTAQNQVTAMQQNLRAVLNLMTRDFRMAGYDGESSSAGTIVAAQPDLFYFTFDLNENGNVDDPGEHIAYDLYDNDGISNLGRTIDNDDISISLNAGGSWVASGHQPVAENIEELEFQYLDDNDNAISSPVAAANLSKIRTVVISILARADYEDPRFNNTMTYTTAGGTDWVSSDHYRRRFQTMTVELRNAGL